MKCDTWQGYMAKPVKDVSGRPVAQKVVPAKSIPRAKKAPEVKPTAVAPSPPEPPAEVQPDPVLLYIARVVHKARKEMGLSQLALSKKAHCNSTAVFMVEAGRQNMTIRSLMQLAAALNLQIGDLFPRSTPRTGAKLNEVAEILTDSTGRIAIQLRTIDRLITELRDEASQ